MVRHASLRHVFPDLCFTKCSLLFVAFLFSVTFLCNLSVNSNVILFQALGESNRTFSSQIASRHREKNRYANILGCKCLDRNNLVSWTVFHMWSERQFSKSSDLILLILLRFCMPYDTHEFAEFPVRQIFCFWNCILHVILHTGQWYIDCFQLAEFNTQLDIPISYMRVWCLAASPEMHCTDMTKWPPPHTAMCKDCN